MILLLRILKLSAKNLLIMLRKSLILLEVSGNVTKLDINVTPNYDKATVNISGNNNLKKKVE